MTESKQGQELKDNKCLMLFTCTHSKRDPCVYFSGEAKCKYIETQFYYCTSPVARINKMTIALDKLKADNFYEGIKGE